MDYDYLVVGAGLFGSIFAYEMTKKGKKCLVIEKRDHIGGNVYTELEESINEDDALGRLIMKFYDEYAQEIRRHMKYEERTLFPYVQAKAKIDEQKAESNIENPKNLEEQAISLIGKDIYEKLVKGYTEKQWGRKCSELPSFIIKRLPVRYTFDNNYFNDLYQGIPIGGYTKIIEKMLEGIEVKLNTDFFEDKDKWLNIADKIIFTGMIDQYYNYCYGELEYRGLNFEFETLEMENYQGNAVINYTDAETPFTRIIEHKHFESSDSPKTIITREYPKTWVKGEEAYYPLNDEKNSKLFKKYQELAKKEDKVIFGGRLGMYQYYDMWQVIDEVLKLVNDL